MKDQARREALREQTIIVEDTTAEIKQLLSKNVFEQSNYGGFLRRAYAIIEERLKELGDTELRESAEKALKAFARKEYKRLKACLTNKAGFSYLALYLVKKIYNTNVIQEKETAFKALQKIEPIFEELQPRFEAVKGFPRWSVPLNEYMHDYIGKVNDTASMLANDYPITESKLPLRLKSELYVRQQWHDKQIEDFKEDGTRLVWTSSHANCSPRCEPYQGKLYSLDHTYGMIGGVKYIPLEKVTDIYVTTKAGKRYKNGIISGFGCRHYLIKYDSKVTPPKLSNKEIDRGWEIDKEQRKLERRVYHLREQYIANKGQNDILAKKYYKLASQAKKEYIAYSEKNKVAWYPSRIKVDF